jgi:hypothetical protein
MPPALAETSTPSSSTICPRASGLIVEPEILAPVRPLTVGLVQEK